MLIEMVGSVTAQSAHAILAKFHEETHDLSSRIELRALVNKAKSRRTCRAMRSLNFSFLFFLITPGERSDSQRRNLKFNFFAFLHESFEMLSFLYLMENYRITLTLSRCYANEGKVTKELGSKIIIR